MKIAGRLGIFFVAALLAMALLTSNAPCQFTEFGRAEGRLPRSLYNWPLINDMGGAAIFKSPHMGLFSDDLNPPYRFGERGVGGGGISPYAGLFADGRHHAVAGAPEAASPRFTITLVREKAILLDKVTGETWILVFPESERTQAYWQPIPKRDAGPFRQDRNKR
jgi:hypothetical protein